MCGSQDLGIQSQQLKVKSCYVGLCFQTYTAMDYGMYGVKIPTTIAQKMIPKTNCIGLWLCNILWWLFVFVTVIGGFESRIPFWLLGYFELEESNNFDLLGCLCLSNATISTSSTSLLNKIGYDGCSYVKFLILVSIPRNALRSLIVLQQWGKCWLS